MNEITEYLNTLSAEQLRSLRKSLYRSMTFSRNKTWNMILDMLDNMIMMNAFSRCEQSDTDTD